MLKPKELLGKKIRWERTLDTNRGTYTEHTGTVTDVQGKNLLIDGDWKWLPHLENVTIVTE